MDEMRILFGCLPSVQALDVRDHPGGGMDVERGDDLTASFREWRRRDSKIAPLPPKLLLRQPRQDASP